MAHRLWYHSTLGVGVMKKKKKHLEGLGQPGRFVCEFILPRLFFLFHDRLGVSGITRAGDAQGTPAQSHISPSIMLHKDDSLLTGVRLISCG